MRGKQVEHVFSEIATTMTIHSDAAAVEQRRNSSGCVSAE
jgi:hypothetical protein